MAQILVRDLDEALVERLKARAARHRRSLEAEVRQILALAEEAPLSWDEAVEACDVIREKLPIYTSNIVDEIRRMRDES